VEQSTLMLGNVFFKCQPRMLGLYARLIARPIELFLIVPSL
jgi:hypothetical protein